MSKQIRISCSCTCTCIFPQGCFVSPLSEPAHEIMVLFVLHKLILQKCMCSHPVGLEVWFLVRLFAYFHTSRMWTGKALARLRGLAWAFAGRLWDKYHNLMSGLIFSGVLVQMGSSIWAPSSDMPSHSAGPGIWLSVSRFLLIHCLYERAGKVLARLHGCAGSPEPSLLA